MYGQNTANIIQSPVHGVAEEADELGSFYGRMGEDARKRRLVERLDIGKRKVEHRLTGTEFGKNIHRGGAEAVGTHIATYIAAVDSAWQTKPVGQSLAVFYCKIRQTPACVETSAAVESLQRTGMHTGATGFTFPLNRFVGLRLHSTVFRQEKRMTPRPEQ